MIQADRHDPGAAAIRGSEADEAHSAVNASNTGRIHTNGTRVFRPSANLVTRTTVYTTAGTHNHHASPTRASRARLLAKIQIQQRIGAEAEQVDGVLDRGAAPAAGR